VGDVLSQSESQRALILWRHNADVIEDVTVASAGQLMRVILRAIMSLARTRSDNFVCRPSSADWHANMTSRLFADFHFACYDDVIKIVLTTCPRRFPGTFLKTDTLQHRKMRPFPRFPLTTQDRNATHGVASPFCPSVCLSHRVLCDKTKETCADILTLHERSFILVLWQEEWLVENDPFYLKFWVTLTLLERKRRYLIDIRS